MNPVLTVFAKEVTDNLRDRRTLLSSLGIAAGGPILFMALISFILDTVIADVEAPIEVAVVGAEFAPNLIGLLERNGVVVSPGPTDPEQAVADRRHEVVMIIPPNFADAWGSGRPAGVRLVYDSARQATSARDHQRLSALLGAVSTQTAALRLQARGIDAAILQPLAVRNSNVATPAARATSALGMIPYFLIFSVFIGGFYLAIDTTAGERDLGSLEPLLTLPVSRDALAMGKLCATALFSLVTLVLSTCAFAIAIDLVPLEELGMTVNFDLRTVVRIILGVAPLALLAAAVMMVVASFTNSFKEAQSWLSPTILIPTMPLLLVGFLSPQPSVLTMSIPSLGQALLVFEAIKGAPVVPEHIAASVLSTLALGVLATLLALRLYRREGLLG